MSATKKVYQDKHGDCADCKAPFIIRIREQIFLETLGYRMPKRCLKCRRSGKPKKKTEAQNIREMFEAGEFNKLFEPAVQEEVAAAPPVQDPVTDGPLVAGTSEENLDQIKRRFSVLPIAADQPEATLEDLKVLMTRAGELRWPCDDYRCRKQHCSANGHIHPYLTGPEAKSLIRGLWQVESSKQLRKPQVDFLFEEFGKVLSGRAYLAKYPSGAVYVSVPLGETEEEVRAQVLAYPTS